MVPLTHVFVVLRNLRILPFSIKNLELIQLDLGCNLRQRCRPSFELSEDILTTSSGEQSIVWIFLEVRLSHLFLRIDPIHYTCINVLVLDRVETWAGLECAEAIARHCPLCGNFFFHLAHLLLHKLVRMGIQLLHFLLILLVMLCLDRALLKNVNWIIHLRSCL